MSTHQRVASDVPQGPRAAGRRCRARQQSDRRHGPQWRHPGCGQSRAKSSSHVLLDGAPDALLDLYDRQRRTVAIEFVQEQSIANKKRLEARDPEARRRNLDELRAIAADPERARQFLLRTSMIASQRRAAALDTGRGLTMTALPSNATAIDAAVPGGTRTRFAGGRRHAARLSRALPRRARRAWEPQIGAFVHAQSRRGARAAADAATARWRAGKPLSPIDGMPVGIKDIIETVDMPTEMGSPLFAGWRSERDAACVSALREAGAVIVGKTVTTEFAATEPRGTRNPLGPRRARPAARAAARPRRSAAA